MIKYIQSPDNRLIKRIVQLQSKSRFRKSNDQFTFEGVKEFNLVVKGNYIINQLVLCPEIFDRSNLNIDIHQYNTVHISLPIYKKIAYRNSTEGIMAIANSKPHHIHDLKLPQNPLVLIAEAPEKPGNIGALLRTADAANVDAVIIANPKTDLYNPNIIRSSLGCVFTNNIGMGTTEEIISFLKLHNINSYCAALNASVTYTQINYNGPTAIVLGTENSGLSDEWLNASTQNILIPMNGTIDSMNVSVAGGILIFEAIRQRNWQ